MKALHGSRLAWVSTIVAGALTLSVIAGGAASARQLNGDDFGEVRIISPRTTVPPLTSDGFMQFKLRTTAGYDVLVNG